MNSFLLAGGRCRNQLTDWGTSPSALLINTGSDGLGFDGRAARRPAASSWGRTGTRAPSGPAVELPVYELANSPGREASEKPAEFFGQPDEKSFRSADVAEPIRVLVLDHFAADKLCAVLAEPGERIVDVVHGKHDA